MMPVGYVDAFSKNCNYFDSLNQCIAKGKAYMDYDRKHAEYAKQTGPIRWRWRRYGGDLLAQHRCLY
ncbi:MAG: hypothetical protein R2881_05985 [Eubacteriales bacterium]